VNTRDPRDPRDPRDTRDPRDPIDPRDTRGTDYRETRVYKAAPEPRRDLRWLGWVIPAALVLLALPFIFRGHREPEQTRTAAVEQGQSPSTSVYLNRGSSALTDADQQKLAQVVSSARQNGSSIAVSGSREGADAVRQALVSQGVPESSIRVSEASTGDPGRVDVTLR
jgi:outer membrane protein OmpA-like peptidoglycan-associated protein